MLKKILVVDDEELVRNYVRRALSSRGYDVAAAVDGASAMAVIEKEDFDLAICDLKMPDLRGEEVIRRLKARRPLTRVIVITGSVSDILNPIFPGLAVEGFLIKPFGINEIRDMVEKILKGRS
ncbi:MAG: response regulator [Elusimicrobia bacterium]|nr:response regulator [Elusimicrobiota bacterium]